jgi:RIP homotypic interaction motif
MDPVTLVVTALAAGAEAALQDGAKSAVKTAYARLRELAKKRCKDPANGEYVLDKHATAPRVWRAPLEAELVEAGAASDRDLVTAAGELMKMLDPRGSQAGKYTVNIHHAQGVQVGDGNTQANYFGATQHVQAGRDIYVSANDQFIDHGNARD